VPMKLGPRLGRKGSGRRKFGRIYRRFFISAARGARRLQYE
jgi:hypothetical protein